MRQVIVSAYVVLWGVAQGCFPPALPQPDGDADEQPDTSVDPDIDPQPDDTETSEDIETRDEGQDTDADEVEDRVFTPTGVSASTDRVGDVMIQWGEAFNATGYRVFRCDGGCADDAWFELTSAPIAETSWIDATTAAPESPEAPTPTATTDLTDSVWVSWPEVVAPTPPSYRYRIVGTGPAGESEPSESVTGHRAPRPVIGYQIEVESAWSDVGPVTEWADPGAGASTVSVGAVSASQGLYANHVELTVAGVSTSPGPTRNYRVRAVTDYGVGAASAVTTGRRAVGATTLRWERSAGASPADFATLAGATGPVAQDTGAPADGSTRYYRVVVSADGAESVVSEPAPGWRQGPPNVPGGVTATADLQDVVRVGWQPVAGAIGYHVYRGETKLTSGNGVTATSYDDSGAPAPAGTWAAPTGVSATSTATDGVTVSWTAPVRPIGAAATYRVSAVNAAGEGARSAEASGRRAAPDLTGFQIELTISGGSARTINVAASPASYLDVEAPLAVITPGTATATQGDHRAHVRLTNTGASLSTAATVSYRVRGALVGGGNTPYSAAAVGRRASGTLTRTWRRSAGTAAVNYQDISTGTSTAYTDIGAPILGEKRWYELVLSAGGASAVTLPAVQGWRLAFSQVAGYDHACAVATDGTVWCWGRGELGWISTTTPRNAARVPGLANVLEVAVGKNTCVRTSAGTVFCWGYNVGDGTSGYRSTPVQLPALSGVTDLAGAESHMCASLSNGEARCWGEWGRLGNNDPNGDNALYPVAVRNASNVAITGVARMSGGVGLFHTCTRQSNGGALCWGDNQNAQLGAWEPYHAHYAVNVGPLNTAIDVVVGGEHTCAIITGGSVKCWGSGGRGQLGNGTTGYGPTLVTVSNLTDAIQLHAGGSTTCARRANGTVVCWGDNYAGQLGNGSSVEYSTVPVQVSTLTAVTSIGGSGYFPCAIQQGDIYCWGNNGWGGVGDGTTTDRNVPTKVVLP